MTKEQDIHLPPYPERSKFTSLWEYTDGQMEDYARAAVELDRQSRGAPVAAPQPAASAKVEPELVVTKGGVPFEDQNEGVRKFKEACMKAADLEAKQAAVAAEPVKGPICYLNPKIIDQRTGKVNPHPADALTWSSKPVAGAWSMPVYAKPVAAQPAASAEPFGWFQNSAVKGEPPHYEQVSEEFRGELDVFPLYDAPVATHAERHPLEAYAESYELMCRIAKREGREPVVSPHSVAFDIRNNMIPATTAPVTAQPSVPNGWKLVPVEPTETMLKAAHTAAYIWRDSPWREAEKARWETILKSAPTPPADGQAQQDAARAQQGGQS